MVAVVAAAAAVVDRSVGRSVGRFLEKQPLSLFVPWATYYFLSTASAAAVAAALMMVRSVVISCVCRRSFIGGMDQVVMILLLVACQSVRPSIWEAVWGRARVVLGGCASLGFVSRVRVAEALLRRRRPLVVCCCCCCYSGGDIAWLAGWVGAIGGGDEGVERY